MGKFTQYDAVASVCETDGVHTSMLELQQKATKLWLKHNPQEKRSKNWLLAYASVNVHRNMWCRLNNVEKDNRTYNSKVGQPRRNMLNDSKIDANQYTALTKFAKKHSKAVGDLVEFVKHFHSIEQMQTFLNVTKAVAKAA